MISPTLTFATKIYHPNVSNDDKGTMCLEYLKNWKPTKNLRGVLESARHLLREPQPDDPVEDGIAKQYLAKRSDWEKVARDWTVKYAKG